MNRSPVVIATTTRDRDAKGRRTDVWLGVLSILIPLLIYGATLNVVRYEARAGTVTVEVQVPRIEGEVPLSATRGGAVDERA